MKLFQKEFKKFCEVMKDDYRGWGGVTFGLTRENLVDLFKLYKYLKLKR
jgi:hypothetical protein